MDRNIKDDHKEEKMINRKKNTNVVALVTVSLLVAISLVLGCSNSTTKTETYSHSQINEFSQYLKSEYHSRVDSERYKEILETNQDQYVVNNEIDYALLYNFIFDNVHEFIDIDIYESVVAEASIMFNVEVSENDVLGLRNDLEAIKNSSREHLDNEKLKNTVLNFSNAIGNQTRFIDPSTLMLLPLHYQVNYRSNMLYCKDCRSFFGNWIEVVHIAMSHKDTLNDLLSGFTHDIAEYAWQHLVGVGSITAIITWIDVWNIIK